MLNSFWQLYWKRKPYQCPLLWLPPQGGGGVDSASHAQRSSPWPAPASAHGANSHELPLSLRATRVFQFLCVHSSERQPLQDPGVEDTVPCVVQEGTGALLAEGQHLSCSGPCSGLRWVLATLSTSTVSRRGTAHVHYLHLTQLPLTNSTGIFFFF